MKRIRFVREGSLFTELEYFKWIKELPTDYVKSILSEDGKATSLFILNNLEQFEQCIEHEYEPSTYGAEEIVSIHFVNKKNFASYLTMKCLSNREIISNKYDNKIISEVHKRFSPKHEWHPYNTEKKAKIIELDKLKSLNLQIDLKNYKKGWPIKDGQFKNDIFYISDDISFCVPISQIVWRLYDALPDEQKISATEKHSFDADLTNGVIKFGFGWEKHVSRKGRKWTGFSGHFSLLDFSGSISNNGTDSYHDYDVT